MRYIEYIVTFKNSKGVEREIGRAKTLKEADDIIQSFLDAHNYYSCYWRKWLDNEDGTKMKIDVGSWSEFFYILRSDLGKLEV